MPLISHRGAAHLAPANSLEAIKLGDSFKPAFVEVDINCTLDGQLIVYHGSVQRFLRGKRTKEKLGEIQSAEPHIMTLGEFLKIKIKSPYLFDIKVTETDLLSKISDEISEISRRDFGFTSPHEKALIFMKKAFPDSIIFQSQPYHHGPVTALEIARKNKFEGIALNKWWLTPFVYKLCAMHGKKIMSYTIDSKIGIWLAHKIFPDAYITTNRPDIYRKMFPND